MATLVEIAAQLVASHASSTPMTTDDLLAEISKVHNALKNLENGQSVEVEGEGKPALNPKEAFKKNEVVCLICGKGGFNTLSRHLNTTHDMRPSAYRKKFGIPGEQPLTSRTYSESRRKAALDRGLADNLVKARAVRLAKIEAKKGGLKKGTKAAVKAPKTTAKAKAV